MTACDSGKEFNHANRKGDLAEYHYQMTGTFVRTQETHLSIFSDELLIQLQ
jgi:hypothetical protein